MVRGNCAGQHQHVFTACVLLMAVQDVVALIAYEHPEQSPLAHLLQLSQREVVADAVNAAILQVTAAGGAGGSSSSSKPQVRREGEHGAGWGWGDCPATQTIEGQCQ